jgi:hypothetical protein
VLHVGGNRFIPSAEIIYKTLLTTGNHLGQMNATSFEKWNTKKLTPNLSFQSVAHSRYETPEITSF